jgi:hypothetical protein
VGFMFMCMRLGIVGSYGTRNVVVIGMMVLERPTECLVLMICLSSILRGIPLSGGGFA